MVPFNKICQMVVGVSVFVGLSVQGLSVFADKKTEYPLSLEEATRLALTNNFDIQLAKYDAWIAQTQQQDVKSIFDTMLSARVTYRDDQSKQSSTMFGTKTVDNDYNIGLSKKLPTGTTLSTSLKNNRNSNNSSFATSTLVHDSTLGISVEQELGKNFFGMQDRGDVKLTKINIENVNYLSLKKIEEHVANVQKAYWDLVLQMEQVHIEEEMADQAKHLYELHQEKLQDGLIEQPEAIASEANYKKRNDTYRLARNTLEAKNNVLKLLLNITDDSAVLVPKEDLGIKEKKIVSEQSLKQAFENRRDYKEANSRLKAKDITLSLKQNSLWPQINLTASLERNGLGDHFSKSVQRITEEDNPDFFAGLTVDVPLENHKAKAGIKSAELEKAKMLIEIKLIERKIAIEIMDQVRDCQLFEQLAGSSQEVSQLQKDKLSEEEKRFNRGRSDTDTLIRFQEELIQARAAAASAKHRYHVSLVDLYVKQGTLLDEYWNEEL